MKKLYRSETNSMLAGVCGGLGDYFGKNCRILADESIRIGGLKVMNQSSGIFMDETLDSRLEDQKPWFYSHSGLVIT